MSLRRSLINTGTPAGDKKPEGLKNALARATFGTALAQPQRPSPGALAAVRKTGTLGFIIDATGSREQTWGQAQRIQGEMFAAAGAMGEMSLRLVHFGGDEMTAHDWQNNAAAVSSAMSRVECHSGRTQFIESFRVFLRDRTNTESIIMIGDSFEENEIEMLAVAHELKNRGIKVFAFLEGKNDDAEEMFRRISDITGGGFAKFGDGFGLGGLCRAVAVYTVGGRAAFEKLLASGDAGAAAITGGIKRLGGPKAAP